MAKTVVFFPESAYGPTNNCVGIGDVMRRAGWRVVFVIEESFEGALAEKGFEERLMRLGPPAEGDEDPGQFWKDFIRETAPVFRKPTIEQLGEFIAPTFEALIDGARYVDERLTEILTEVRPDVVVVDNVVSFPAAVGALDIPWVRIVSCNPAEVKDRLIPPTFSGYPSEDVSGWEQFRQEYAQVIEPLHAGFDEFCRERGAPPLPPGELIHDSPDLNLWLYPDDVDYPRSDPLEDRPGAWRNLHSSVRATDESWALPTELGGDDPLVYLSLGSLGSGDVELMRKLIGSLSGQAYRVIVSMGPQHAKLELGANMVGAEFLPQTSILPQVDLVITHGGNNTVTESLHFGKPMVLLPLFWDQYDNAQRIDETGFGRRLSTYAHEPGELQGAIDDLLENDLLGARLGAVSSWLQAQRGTDRAAEAIATAAN